MIPVEKEPKEIFQEFGVYEFCYFCMDKKTDTWHKETNTPVCVECSKTKDVDDINKNTNTC